jgi:cell division protein ZipA
MQANWSLILNVLLLIGVIVAIWRLMKARKQNLNPERYQPSPGVSEKNMFGGQNFSDDIIAVRKVNAISGIDNEGIKDDDLQVFKRPTEKSSPPRLMPEGYEQEVELKIEAKPAAKIEPQAKAKVDAPATIMMFLLAKQNRQFAGYELLQTVLAAGLRFGEGHLFHRHQFPNGQGPVLFSLAAATATGVFDLQNIGAFSVRGLCLYMHPAKNPGIDRERLGVMLETARQLSEGLDAHLLDDQRKPLTEERISRYHQLLQMNQSQSENVT